MSQIVEALRRMSESDLVRAGLPRAVAREMTRHLATRDRLRKPSDLLAVKGIGPRRLERLVGYVESQCGE